MGRSPRRVSRSSSGFFLEHRGIRSVLRTIRPTGSSTSTSDSFSLHKRARPQRCALSWVRVPSAIPKFFSKTGASAPVLFCAENLKRLRQFGPRHLQSILLAIHSSISFMSIGAVSILRSSDESRHSGIASQSTLRLLASAQDNATTRHVRRAADWRIKPVTWRKPPMLGMLTFV